METNKFKKIIHYAGYGLIFVAGLLIGRLIFGGSAGRHDEITGHTHEDSAEQLWTCAMHPQIRQNRPGKCPLCGMDLALLKMSGNGDEAVDPNTVRLSKEAAALADIQTTVVSRRNPVKDIQLYGTIQADERLSQSQTSHVGGRIEKLFVNFTGESVRQGETIAAVYSPELLNAQQELLEAAKMQSVHPDLVQSAREKLRLWKLTDEQIAAIEQSGNVSVLVEIKAGTGGIVTGKRVNAGDYINPGSILFDIADLSQVWAMFDAYEADLPFLKVGDKVDFTLQAMPGKTFTGRISFIDPILDKTARTAKVRVEAANPGMQLKPEMYAGATVKAPLKQFGNAIVIPKSAVLWTGKRSIVYVKQPDTPFPEFTLREVELGPSLGDSYVALSGLNDGDEIVTGGAFTVDASAQLEGKRSMMNTEMSHQSAEIYSSGNCKLPDVPSGITNAAQRGDTKQSAVDKIGYAVIDVQGLCGMCKKRIEETAKGVSGVTSASWDQKTKQLQLTFDPVKTGVDAVSKAVAKAGHDTGKYKTDQAVYDALPECCKYRKQE